MICHIVILVITIGSLSPASAQKLCDFVSIGHTPLTGMTTETWNGQLGGLYPGGSNVRPYEQQQQFLDLALSVRACRSDGVIDNVDGRIVVLAIGSSDAKSGFNNLALKYATDTLRNPTVRFLNATVDGLGLQKTTAGNAEYWGHVNQQIQIEGFSIAQVQIAWVMLDDTNNSDTTFPKAAEDVADQLRQLCVNLKVKYPAIKFVYFSGRPYSAYINPTTSTLGPGVRSPRDYLYGWGVKKIIERQIFGTEGYGFDGAGAQIPAVSWAGYVWADGATANSDGLAWLCSDYESDGFSLSPSGSEKIGKVLYEALSQDQVSKGWFTNPTPVSVSQGATSADLKIVSTESTLRIVASDANVEVLDFYGIQVWSGRVTSSIDIPTISWPRGLYVVRVGTKTSLILH
ncbi:MAG: T9SS type A sorting domain-containing protein [Candidatus Kapabacteria bacterium]|nr:T9SS type A sorting domain-containing protein [Candidatus Kapabacteria bacterium]